MNARAEIDCARRWMTARIDSKTPPFSFLYGGQPSAILLDGCKRTETEVRLDTVRTRRVIAYHPARAGLAVRCEAVSYRGFPVVEWTVYMKNTGKCDTPLITDLWAVDVELARSELPAGSVRAAISGAPRLHYNIGSPTKPEDYRPLESTLKPGNNQRIATCGGRPCDAHMPFFNLEWSGAGVIMAIGWPGQWAADFRRERSDAVRLCAGQELTRFVLHPGEEVRTPLIALLFYQGDRVCGQNFWRRWMVAHNVPRPGGKLPAPMLCGMAWFYFAPWGTSNAQAMKVFIDTYEARRLPIDAWWIDAGWYNCDTSIPETGYSVWPHTGTWEPDRRRFPHGVREVNDHAHKKGLKTILWFEPSRVVKGTWLARKHPEWLLPPPPGSAEASQGAFLLNFGHPAALRWLINRFDRILAREHVDIYREDFNTAPLPFWRAHDAPDRQGITEIRFATGQIALWDELRRRHPHLLIDNVASGSRRIELEGFRRAVTLWRSDYMPGIATDEERTRRIAPNQCITHGIASWLPYFGTAVNAIDAYRFRSFMSPSLAFDFDPRRDDLDHDLWRRLMTQFKSVAEHYYGDYYPLTPYSLRENVWMAWQFHSPDKDAGMVQAFRREACREKYARFRLRGLRPGALYEMVNQDTGSARCLTGNALMDEGLRLTAKNRPDALLLSYRRTSRRPPVS
ncbi:MAG: alpha-galactosidase [Kiritimatiellae bacterium]|nr:alpha-galactosidase [Kiritimatiellia bacterium]